MILYRGIANQPSHAYSSLYLSDFLSFLTLNIDFFCQRIIPKVSFYMSFSVFHINRLNEIIGDCVHMLTIC